MNAQEKGREIVPVERTPGGPRRGRPGSRPARLGIGSPRRTGGSPDERGSQNTSRQSPPPRRRWPPLHSIYRRRRTPLSGDGADQTKQPGRQPQSNCVDRNTNLLNMVFLVVSEILRLVWMDGWMARATLLSRISAQRDDKARRRRSPSNHSSSAYPQGT